MNLFAKLLDQRSEAQKANEKAAQELAKIEEQAEQLRSDWEPHAHDVEYAFNTRNACRDVLNGETAALESETASLGGVFVNNPQNAGPIARSIAERKSVIPILQGALDGWEKILADKVAAAKKFAAANGIPKEMWPPGLA